MLIRWPRRASAGFSLLEILVSMVVFSFGLLAIAGLQLKLQSTHVESQQRSHAVTLMRDMVERINANITRANAYISPAAAPVGAGDGRPARCDGIADIAQRDLCEWSRALKGGTETSGEVELGGLLNAVGCIEEIQAPDPTNGICRPGTYRITLAWQGVDPLFAPDDGIACGRGRFGEENLRRVTSSDVLVGVFGCR